MLSARWLKPEHEERQYRVTRATRDWFDRLARRYMPRSTGSWRAAG
jgi:multidrug efflux pump